MIEQNKEQLELARYIADFNSKAFIVMSQKTSDEKADAFCQTELYDIFVSDHNFKFYKDNYPLYKLHAGYLLTIFYEIYREDGAARPIFLFFENLGFQFARIFDIKTFSISAQTMIVDVAKETKYKDEIIKYIISFNMFGANNGVGGWN
jgi:hypothetical protein